MLFLSYCVLGIVALSESMFLSVFLLFTAYFLWPRRNISKDDFGSRDTYKAVHSSVNKDGEKYIKQKKWRNIFEHRKISVFEPEHDFVYVISNDAFEGGIFKIGMTTQLPKDRVKQINSATGVPQPFLIDILISTQNAKRLESALHSHFSDKRVSNNREFFNLARKDIIWIVNNHNTIYTNYEHLNLKHSYDLMSGRSSMVRMMKVVGLKNQSAEVA